MLRRVVVQASLCQRVRRNRRNCFPGITVCNDSTGSIYSKIMRGERAQNALTRISDRALCTRLRREQWVERGKVTQISDVAINVLTLTGTFIINRIY